MNLENLKYDFPKMPEEMRKLVEGEVKKQMGAKTKHTIKTGWLAKRTIAASAAAVLLAGTTAFAGIRAYRMSQDRTGAHGVEIKISENEEAAGKNFADSQKAAPVHIPDVKMELGYLPEGMAETEEGKYSFSDTPYQGGVSIVFYRMDTGDDAFSVKKDDVQSSEDILVNGHEGVYLVSPDLYEDAISFNQRMYVAFPEVHYVMEMYIGSDVPKEEALKIAEGITLAPTQESDEMVHAWDWSAYLASQQPNESAGGPQMRTCIAKEAMKNTHAIGESFSVHNTDNGNLTVKVSDVRVSDDISLLDSTLIDDELKDAVDENKKLLPATIQYIKEGDSESLSEVIKTREIPQKLIYVTVEYTNTGGQELNDVLFMGGLMRISEKNNSMYIDGADSYEEPVDGDAWTVALNRSPSMHQEMYYYDVFGGERHNNYIESIRPNETVTVHMGWIVTEEELGKLYLNLDTYGGTYEFSDTSLEMGYVDIRQPQ